MIRTTLRFQLAAVILAEATGPKVTGHAACQRRV